MNLLHSSLSKHRLPPQAYICSFGIHNIGNRLASVLDGGVAILGVLGFHIVNDRVLEISIGNRAWDGYRNIRPTSM